MATTPKEGELEVDVKLSVEIIATVSPTITSLLPIYTI